MAVASHPPQGGARGRMERKGWLAVRSRWLHHPPPPRGASNVAGGRRYRGWKIGVRKTAERTIADGTTPPVFRPLLLARRFYLNYSSLHVSLTTTPRVFQITHTLTLVRFFFIPIIVIFGCFDDPLREGDDARLRHDSFKDLDTFYILFLSFTFSIGIIGLYNVG